MPGRVLHLVANLDVGGAQEVVVSLVPHLSAYGWDTMVATLRDGPMRGRLDVRAIPLAVLPGRTRPLLSGIGAPREILALRRALTSLVTDRRIDVVQTHLARSTDLLVLSLRWGHGPGRVKGVLWTVHNARLDLRADQVPNPALLTLKRAAYRWSYRTGSHLGADFVAVSDAVAASIEREIRPRAGSVHTIANGVDTARFVSTAERPRIRAELRIPPDAPTLAVVAKLTAQKGHRDLIAALVPVRAKVPALRVLMVGEGPLRRELEAETAALGLTDTVSFLGLRTDIPAILSAVDGFVLPSLWEGLPVALLEAMASGLPIVATAVSGTVQVVEDGVSGILVPTGDPRALATGILTLLHDRDRARAIGAAARARVDARFSVRRQAEQHAMLYDELASRARAHR